MKKEVLLVFVLLLIILPFVSAGVGIKWDQESFLVNQGEKNCISYGVYNPWNEESYVKIDLPDNLKQVLVSQEAETKLIPANTSSGDAIPVKFCFKSPEVYPKDCIMGIICKQECPAQQISYDGDISVVSVPSSNEISGSGGSKTQMSVSAPLKLRVQCVPHGYDYTILYIIIIIIALIGIFVSLFIKYRKPEAERKKEKLQKLKEEMKNLKRNK